MTKQLPFRYNTGGRGQAGFKGYTGDCTIRALACMLNRSVEDTDDWGVHYRAVYTACMTRQLERGSLSRMERRYLIGFDGQPRQDVLDKGKCYGVHKDDFRPVYEAHGFKAIPVGKLGRTVGVAGIHRIIKCDFIVEAKAHNYCVIAGKVNDSWDPQQGGRGAASRDPVTIHVDETIHAEVVAKVKDAMKAARPKVSKKKKELQKRYMALHRRYEWKDKPESYWVETRRLSDAIDACRY